MLRDSLMMHSAKQFNCIIVVKAGSDLSVVYNLADILKVGNANDLEQSQGALSSIPAEFSLRKKFCEL